MKKFESKSPILSKKQMRRLALLFVALLTASTILILGGFEINWTELLESFLEK
ncbi:hypothetical protein [Bernardetia sp.]|uniref:hypothetical protein n=1 Tax=Bernardetia sp. TaxID=1937974 RepID=UPI0025BED605|nr:hypothetical protein [Bernardetia sp.]